MGALLRHIKAKIIECRSAYLILGATAVHWLATFYTDTFVFQREVSANYFDYAVCKAIALTVLYFFYRTLYRVVFCKRRKEFSEFHVLKYAALYLIPIVAVLIFKLPQGFLSNDETLIFEAAVNLEHYTWFYYITVYYYIVCLMLIPSWVGPILIKVLIQLLVCGYCVYRLSRYLGFKYGKFLYLVFLLFPVLAYTTSAHRLPIYFFLYLLMCFVLLMDLVEKVPLSRPRFFWLLFLGTLLTQWRTEGIYLALLAPLLMFAVYRELRNKKMVLLTFLTCLIMQYAVSIPQNGLFPSRLDSQADNRMGPFYAYTVTNMYRNGLDLEKNKEDLAAVDRFLSLDAIEAINEYYGDINYEDVLILYQPGYVGTRDNASPEDYASYTKACRNIFLHNPGVLMKTRWGAFCYAAMPYRITPPAGGLHSLLSFGLSVVKTVSYNLFLPCLMVLGLWVYSMVRRRLYTFLLTSGLLGHWFIVFILAPASYFKYYFPIYIMAYFYAALLIIQAVYNHFHGERKVDFLA